MRTADFTRLATLTSDVLGVSLSPVISSLWSISLEEQFYFIWPIAVMFLSRRGIGVAAVVGWLLTVRLIVFSAGHGTAGILVLAHLDSIFAGLAIVGFGLKGRPAFCLAGAAAWVLGTHCLVYSHNPIGESLGLVGIGLGSGAFLLSCMGVKALANRVTVYLGRVSYGLYVFHGLALAIAMMLLPQFAVAPAAFAATIAIAAVSYRYLERPFLKLKERFQYLRSQPLMLNEAA
jgi:peptidoglycan/LPS O-acetylase OafA/YrhL